MLDSLLFVRTSEDKERKHIVSDASENLWAPPSSHARQVADPPRTGPQYAGEPSAMAYLSMP